MIYRKLTILAVAVLAFSNFTNVPTAVGQISEMTDLFNGKNLDGWYGLKTMNPRKMKAMSEEEFAKFVASTEAETKKHWTVENGELVNDGKGAYLTTKKDFGDYELRLEYKTVAKAEQWHLPQGDSADSDLGFHQGRW